MRMLAAPQALKAVLPARRLLLAAVAAALPSAVGAGVEWPSYNRSLTSERFVDVKQIDAKNVRDLRVVCTYDTGQTTAFQSGLIQVQGALLATTEHDTISLDPDTCAQNWRVHEDFVDSYLGAQRGALPSRTNGYSAVRPTGTYTRMI